ncbi:MAG: hypothetical protein JSR95_04460, partial [Proteobacteria bacterium]|nr:hypothetical protein [Pseudomonadota bacterium]
MQSRSNVRSRHEARQSSRDSQCNRLAPRERLPLSPLAVAVAAVLGTTLPWRMAVAADPGAETLQEVVVTARKV